MKDTRLASTFSSSANPLFNSLSGVTGSTDGKHPELFCAQLMIVDEEFFELTQEQLTQVVHMLDVGKAVIFVRYRDNSVVPFFVFLVVLLAFDDSDQPTLHNDARKRGFIHQHQNIDGITGSTFSSRDESEIVRKCHACGQNFLQFKYPLFRIKRVLVTAPFRRFDNHLDDFIVVAIQSLKPSWVRQPALGIAIFTHESSYSLTGHEVAFRSSPPSRKLWPPEFSSLNSNPMSYEMKLRMTCRQREDLPRVRAALRAA